MSRRVPVAVFASGGGTNLQALLDREDSGPDCPYRVTLVVSDRESAGALDRAHKAGREAVVVPVSGRDLEEVGRETLALLREHDVRMICLAGYLRLIPGNLVEAFPKRILNVHPALLPGFGGKGMYGMHVHRAVLASGATFSGPTVHFVDEEYDTGSIVAQWPVPVQGGDTPEELGARVLKVEHRLYPACAAALARAVREDRTLEPFRLEADAFVASERDPRRIDEALLAASSDD